MNKIKAEYDGQQLSVEGVNKIRLAFYDVIVTLFMNYKESVGTDPDGEIIFHKKKFKNQSDKRFEAFYNRFF